jgi:hypothetical protein
MPLLLRVSGLVLLFWLGAAAAQSDPSPAAPAAAAQDDASASAKADGSGNADTNDLIRETRVIFPERAGAFTLFRAVADPQVEAGISLQYNYGGENGLDFDVFVYPLGRAWESAAMKLGMEEMLGSFAAAEKAGHYRELKLRKPRDVSMQPDPLLTLHGKHVVFEAQRQDAPVISHGLLFYRSYYLVKLRLTVVDKSRRRDADRLVASALQELLPRIRLQHTGGCAAKPKISIGMVDRLPRNAETSNVDGSEVLMTRSGSDRKNAEALAGGIARRLDANCVDSFDDKAIAEGEKFETLRFRPGTWAAPAKDSQQAPAAGGA